jgi:hypothetical protein
MRKEEINWLNQELIEERYLKLILKEEDVRIWTGFI